MYMSDLAAINIANQHGTSLPSFADDMSMYCSCSTPDEACQVVSRAISILNEAISSRGLAMKHDKAFQWLYVLHSPRPCLCLQVALLNR